MELDITLRKMIYSLKEEFNQYTDDNFFSNEYLAYQIDKLREDFISRTYENPAKIIADSLYSKICLELEDYPNECNEDIHILRTKLPLPNYFNFPGRNYIRGFSFGSVTLKYVNRIELERVPYFTASKYSNTQLYYTIDTDGRLLVLSPDRLILSKSLSISMILRSFEDALKHKCGPCQSEDSDCIDLLDMPYPIDGMIHTVILQTLRQQVFSKFNIQQDKQNDGDNMQAPVNYPAKRYRDRVEDDTNRTQE